MSEYTILAVGRDSDRLRDACDSAASEQIVVKRAEQIDAQFHALLSPDHALIVLDAGYRKADWVGECRKIRAAQSTAGSRSVPLVVIAEDESIAQGRAEGVTDWLIAPFTPDYARTRLRAWVMRQVCRWKNAPSHPREDARLASLRKLNILDTAREERFDNITRTAAATFGVPVALVSLIDKHRQWFKSAAGLETTETPRDMAFCAHAILQQDPLIVSDTREDLRFADNPLVTGDPNVRFYAGAPITSSDGLPMGTICLIDTKPRTLDARQVDVLKDLARQVSEQLRARPDAIADM